MKQPGPSTAALVVALACFASALTARAAVRPWVVGPDPVRLQPLPLTSIDLGTGLRLLWTRSPAPLFEASLILAAPPDVPSLALLIQSARFRVEGTSSCPGPAFTECLGRNGIRLDVAADADTITLTVHALAEKGPEALAMLGEMVVRPPITGEGLAVARSALQSLVAERGNDPVSVATDRLFQQLFGAQHRYAGALDYGDLADLSVEQVSAWTREMVCADRALLVVSSPFPGTTIGAWVSSAFDAWQGCDDAGTEQPPAPDIPASAQTGVRLEGYLETRDTALVVGRRLDPADFESVAAARVVARILARAVGAPEGASERAGANVQVYRGAGVWWAWTSALEPTEVARLWDETMRIARGEVTDREINQAIRAEIASVLRQMDGTGALASLEARCTLWSDCPVEPVRYLSWLQAATPRLVKARARTLLSVDSLVVVRCGPGVETGTDELGQAQSSPLSAEK